MAPENTNNVTGAAGLFPAAYIRACREVLDNALASVPAYQMWQSIDRGAAAPVDERYRALPAMTKNELRAFFPLGLIPVGKDPSAALSRGEIEYVKTSGSTQEALTNIWYDPWWNDSERASWTLNSAIANAGLGNHREAILASPRCVGLLSENGDLSMEQRTLDRLLFLAEKPDPSAWPPDVCNRMLFELSSFRPLTIEANPSFLSILCRNVISNRQTAAQPKAVILTYENPSVIHLRHIRHVFSCPVISSYGSTETGYVFMECEKGRLHQNIDFCRVDFEPLQPKHGGPAIGRILVTTFHNPWRVLIRFDVGDLVRVSRTPCPCGRNQGLTLDAIEGRTINVTLATDGRLVTQRAADLAVGSVDGVAQYQINQTGRTAYHIMFIKEENAPADTASRLEEVLHQLYGRTAAVTMQEVGALHPEPSGKYRLARADFEINIDNYLDTSTGHKTGL